VCELVCVLFPVLAVELHYHGVLQLLVKAIDINIDAVGIRPRNIERLDATGLAEIVLGYTTVESIGVKRILSLKQFESIAWQDQVQIPRFGTDGTIAALNLDRFFYINLETHCTTVATTLILHRLHSLLNCSNGIPDRF